MSLSLFDKTLTFDLPRVEWRAMIWRLRSVLATKSKSISVSSPMPALHRDSAHAPPTPPRPAITTCDSAN